MFYLFVADFMKHLPVQIYLIFTSALWVSSFYPHFTDEETKVQKGVLTCLKSRWFELNQDVNPNQSDLRTFTCIMIKYGQCRVWII